MTYGPCNRCLFHVLHGRLSVQVERTMRHSKAFPGTREDQHAPTTPLYSLPLRSKREPRHFTFISYRWFFGGSRAIDDNKEPYYGLLIVQDTLTEARRLIIVMTFNDDSSASRPPPSSPSILACPPSACVSSCRTSCCPPRRTPSPRAWRPSLARRRARAVASATCRP